MKSIILAISLLATSPAAAKPSLISAISAYSGMHEVRHRAKLKRVLGIDPRIVPWCGAMLTVIAKRAGRKPPQGSFKASSWLSYGRRVSRSQARPGDIAVVRGGRHVIVFTGFKSGRACGWAGNTSNKVAHGCWGGLVGVRR